MTSGDTNVYLIYLHICKPKNFHVVKFSLENFSHSNIFVETNPHVNVRYIHIIASINSKICLQQSYFQINRLIAYMHTTLSTDLYETVIYLLGGAMGIPCLSCLS